MNYVSDTHALIWFLFDQSRLTIRVRDIFRQTDAGQHTIYVPTVVVAVIIMIVEKGRVQGTVPELLSGFALMEQSGHYSFLPPSPNLVIASQFLPSFLTFSTG